MELSKAERKRILNQDMLKLFKMAKKRLKKGKEEFICIALGNAAEKLKEGGCKNTYWWACNITRIDEACSRATKYIEKSLQNVSSYEIWMQLKHPNRYYEMRRLMRETGLVSYIKEDERKILKNSPFTKGRVDWLTAVIKIMEETN